MYLNLWRASWASLFTGCVLPNPFDRSLGGGRDMPAWEWPERRHKHKTTDCFRSMAPLSLPLRSALSHLRCTHWKYKPDRPCCCQSPPQAVLTCWMLVRFLPLSPSGCLLLVTPSAQLCPAHCCPILARLDRPPSSSARPELPRKQKQLLSYLRGSDTACRWQQEHPWHSAAVPVGKKNPFPGTGTSSSLSLVLPLWAE